MIDLLKELAEPSKRTILGLIKSGPKSVGELVDATGMKQPNVSNHLARMKSKGLVRATKVGRQVYYSLATAEIGEALDGLVINEEIPGEDLTLGEDLTKAFSKAAVAGDEFECTRLVDTLVRQRIDIVHVYESLFADSLVMIGKWWEVGAIDVGQEHMASAIIERLMARVLHHSAPPKATAHSVVLGCVEGNWHSLGLRMVADVMRLSGWRTFYLGANVPTESFVSAVREHRPSVVLVSCPLDDQLPAAWNLLGQLNELHKSRPFVLGGGGRAFVENEGEARKHGIAFVARSLSHFTEHQLSELEKQASSSSRN
ncbi:MAG: metalloregulator ArsR/SmtB family transcription factor [Armatimonadetes bacterium]|nr:metalloregulator ArsR/SmtB family transcription factor [Armatimonadota bacterium]